MKIKRVDGPPKDILTFDLDVENELNLTPQQVEDVAEIFNTHSSVRFTTICFFLIIEKFRELIQQSLS